MMCQVLAGNDKVKTDAGREGLLPLIVASMDRHVSRAALVEAGCSAITSLTLRQSENSVSVVKECDGALIITLVMSKHPTNRKVQVRKKISGSVVTKLHTNEGN